MIYKIVIIFCAILLNGLFSIVEVALIRSKRWKIERLSKEGSRRANKALYLLDNTGKFLSSVQIAITFISIFTGAISSIEFSEVISQRMELLGISPSYSKYLSIILIVGGVTYFSLVLGELFPKKLGMLQPEKVLLNGAYSMFILMKIFSLPASFLNVSSDIPFKIMKLKKEGQDFISEEEFFELLNESLKKGMLERLEHRMIGQIKRLSDLPVTSIMIPRTKVVTIPVNIDVEKLKLMIKEKKFKCYPVYSDTIDNIIGVLNVEDLIPKFLEGEEIRIEGLIRQPVVINETKNLLEMLKVFLKSKAHLAIIVDEYGGFKGIITVRDFLKAIISEFSSDSPYEMPFRRRSDGSWVVSGSIEIDSIVEKLGIDIEEKEKNFYKTLSGFVLYHLGKIPQEGDSIFVNGYRIEIIDMDGRRIDKVLIIPPKK